MLVFFLFALAIDAEFGDGASLQTRNPDLFAALVADAENTVIHALQSGSNFFDQLPFTVPDSQSEGPVGFNSGPIRRIGADLIVVRHVFQGHFALRSVENLPDIAWLGFAEQKLLAFTSGAVFNDDDGRLTQARARLAYFPDNVWLYKIACQWRRIALWRCW